MNAKKYHGVSISDNDVASAGSVLKDWGWLQVARKHSSFHVPDNFEDNFLE